MQPAHPNDGRGELGVVEGADELLVVQDVALALLQQLQDLGAGRRSRRGKIVGSYSRPHNYGLLL